MLPSTNPKASAPRTSTFSVLISPAHPYRYRRFACPLAGTDARLAEKRGSVTPSFQGTCTPYLLPVRLAHRILMLPGNGNGLLVKGRPFGSVFGYFSRKQCVVEAHDGIVLRGNTPCRNPAHKPSDDASYSLVPTAGRASPRLYILILPALGRDKARLDAGSPTKGASVRPT